MTDKLAKRNDLDAFTALMRCIRECRECRQRLIDLPHDHPDFLRTAAKCAAKLEELRMLQIIVTTPRNKRGES